MSILRMQKDREYFFYILLTREAISSDWDLQGELDLDMQRELDTGKHSRTKKNHETVEQTDLAG